MDFVVFGLGAAVGGISGALVLHFLGNFALSGRIAKIEGDLERYKAGGYGVQGRQKQVESEERLMAAATEIMAAVQSGQPVGDAIKSVAVKYPDVALKMAGKFGLKL